MVCRSPTPLEQRKGEVPDQNYANSLGIERFTALWQISFIQLWLE